MTAADSSQTTYQRVPTWLHRLSAGKVILLRPGSDPKAIQGIAVALWLLIDEPATTALLSEELAPFTTEPHTSSLEEAIALLCEQGIIEQVPEAT